jgi:hypothetical protein
LATPTNNEQVLFDALDYCVLPTTASGLVAADGSGRVTRVPLVEPRPGDLVVDCSRRPEELAWVATKERLHVLMAGGSRAAAFELGVRPYNSATDLAGITSAIQSREFAGAHYFFVNTYDDCHLSRLHGGDLEHGAAIPHRVFATAQVQGTLFAAGLTPDPAGVQYPTPLLLDVLQQRAFAHENLNPQLRDMAVRRQGALMPSKYIAERLHCDAFLACASGARGDLAIVGGIAEATLATDFGAPDEPEHAPQLHNYVGIAYLRFSDGGLQMEDVDLGYSYLASAEAEDRSPLYVVKTKKTHGQLLGDIAVHRDWPCLHDRPEPLTFAGCSPDTAFNKMRVAHRKGCGYLAVVNTFWGDQGGKFAPRDLFLTSGDGVHWTCASSSDAFGAQPDSARG